jgi:S-adenosylmethionine-dependent methyltransferase
MIDDLSDIQQHYGADPDHEHDRLIRHQLEYEITLALFKLYLPPKARVLEIGAATGRYSIELLRQGHLLTIVDLTPAMVEACTTNVSSAGFAGAADLHVADARDLSAFGDSTFDAILLMGPLYHLVLEADRELALQQALDRLVPGGLIFSAFISRFGILGDLMTNAADWIEKRDEVRSVIDRGRDPENWPTGGFRGYFSDVAEIIPLHERHGFETIELAAVEPAISADDASYNRLEGEQHKLWFDLLFEVRNNPTTIGASRHLLYVGTKVRG